MKIVVYFLSLVATIICIALAVEFGLAQLMPDAYRGYLIEEDNDHMKWAVGPYEPANPALAFNSPITLEKPADTIRIISLGASGTEGWLTAETVFKKYNQSSDPAMVSSYSRAIEFTMNEIADSSSKRVEVINLGIAAYNITDVIRMLKDSLRLDPDLFLIQIGGNETWTAERQNWASYLDNDIPYLYSELGYEVLTDTQGGWDTLATEGNAFNPMALFNAPKPLPILPEPPGRTEGIEQRLANYRVGLDKLAEYLTNNKIPTLFLIPSQNLADFEPFGSMARAGTSEQQLEELNKLLIDALSERGPQSKDKYIEILQLDDGISEANFQLAKIYLAEQDSDRAREHFWKANDRDLILKRLPRIFTDASREFLERNSFPYIDVMKFYESKSDDGVVGYNWLDDDVHPNRQAQFELGAQVVALILEQKLLNAKGYDAEFQSLPTFAEYNAWTGFDQKAEAVIAYLKAAHNFLSFGRFRQRMRWDPHPDEFLGPIIDQLDIANKYASSDSSLYLSTVLNFYLDNRQNAENTIEQLDCGSSAERGARAHTGVMIAAQRIFGQSNKSLRSDLRQLLISKGCIK